MSNKKQTLTVKLKKGKDQFEILCKPNGAIQKYRDGKLSADNTLITDDIFKNASKFLKVKSTDLKKSFGTDDSSICLKEILDHGSFQLTKNEINHLTNHKYKEITNFIHKYYLDPSPDIPRQHPVSRIENALKQLNPKIDLHINTDRQAREIAKKLPSFIPLKPSDKLPLSQLEIAKQNRVEKSSKNGGKGKNGRGGNKKNSGKNSKFDRD